MIEVTGLSKRYGNHLAVDNVSFSISKGEIVGFLGPNGAGKSTIMNIITGYLSLTQGEVSVDGYDVAQYPEEAKKRIGYLPEIPPLYMDMKVREYLNFIYDLKKVTFPKKPHIDEILRLVLLKIFLKVIVRESALLKLLWVTPMCLFSMSPPLVLTPSRLLKSEILLPSLEEIIPLSFLPISFRRFRLFASALLLLTAVR